MARPLDLTKLEGKIKTVLLSVSGGRTSHYMIRYFLDNRAEVAERLGIKESELEYKLVFANTGLEHDDTLRFVRDTAKHFNVEIVWVEGVPVFGERVATQHRIVNYDTAYRLDQYKDINHPYTAHVRRYGVPTISKVNCTREMKRNAINSYMRSIGHDEKTTFITAIGIRFDEESRCANKPEERNLVYPMAHWVPTIEQQVLDFWSQFEWDLTIPRWLGNCVHCYEKADSVLERAYLDYPTAFEIVDYYEKTYAGIGYEFTIYDDAEPRATFRGNEYAADMIARFKVAQDDRTARGIPLENIKEHRELLADERRQARSHINAALKPFNKTGVGNPLAAAWFFGNWDNFKAANLQSVSEQILTEVTHQQKMGIVQKGLARVIDESGQPFMVKTQKPKKPMKIEEFKPKKAANKVVTGTRALLEGTANLSVEDIIKLVAKFAFRDYADQLTYTSEEQLVATLLGYAPELNIPTSQRTALLMHDILAAVEGIRVMDVEPLLRSEVVLAITDEKSYADLGKVA